MARVLLFGVASAVLAAVIMTLGALWSLNLQNVLVGIAAGAVLGLVRMRTPVARVGGFLIGYVLAIVMYGLRLALLPATVAGNIVATCGLIIVLTVISALTKDRMQLWAMFLGCLVFSASYDGYFLATPWYALSQIPGVATAVLVSVAAGFLVTLLVELRVERGGVDPRDPMAPAPPVGPDSSAVAVSGGAVSAQAGQGPDSGLQVLDSTGGAQ